MQGSNCGNTSLHYTQKFKSQTRRCFHLSLTNLDTFPLPNSEVSLFLCGLFGGEYKPFPIS